MSAVEDMPMTPAQEFGRYVNMQLIASDEHPEVPGGVVLTWRVVGRPKAFNRFVAVTGYGHAIRLSIVKLGSETLDRIATVNRNRMEGRT